jgi:hypothetical protein
VHGDLLFDVVSRAILAISVVLQEMPADGTLATLAMIGIRHIPPGGFI